MAISFLDGMAGAANDPLLSHDPVIGSSPGWVRGSGNAVGEMELTGNNSIFRAGAGSGNNSYLIVDLADADDYDVPFAFEVASQAENWFHLDLDIDTVGSTRYQLTWKYTPDDLWLMSKVVAGVETPFGPTVARTYANGTRVTGLITRRTESGDTVLRLYLNGVLVATWTDSTSPLTPTRRVGHHTDADMTITTGLQLAAIGILNVGEASFTTNPTTLTAGTTGNNVDLAGVETPWEVIGAGFSITTTGSGAAITATNITDDVTADIDVNAGTSGTITITDNSTLATDTITVSGGAIVPGVLTIPDVQDVESTASWTAASGGVAPITAQLMRKLGAGAYAPVGGATSSPFNDTGLTPNYTQYTYKVTFTDAALDTADSNEVVITTAHVNELLDLLVDEEFLESVDVGLTAAIELPTKSPNNPISPPAGPNNGTYDFDKYYGWMKKFNDYDVRFWFGVVDDTGAIYQFCFFASEDGITLTNPNLGIITYDGNTNNSLVRGPGDGAGGGSNSDLVDAEFRFMAFSANLSTDPTASLVALKSIDGFNWLTSKVIATYSLPAPPTDLQEGKTGIRRGSDGRYLAWYTQGHFEVPPLRQMGAYISDTDDPDGTWTDLGYLIEAPSTNFQAYACVNVIMDQYTWFAMVDNYDEATGTYPSIGLWVSHDEGLSWTEIEADWVLLGSGADWDSGMLASTQGLATFGNETRFYYTGTPEVHGTLPPLDERLGYATVGFNRFGSLSGTGEVITKAIMPNSVIYNKAAAGSFTIAVLDANDDSVITGFDDADFDVVAGDLYRQRATWGGLEIPAGTAVKLRLTLTGATVYSYQFAAIPDFDPLYIAASGTGATQTVPSVPANVAF